MTTLNKEIIPVFSNIGNTLKLKKKTHNLHPPKKTNLRYTVDSKQRVFLMFYSQIYNFIFLTKKLD